MPRPSWNDYFFDIARVVATRATCDRRHVGCVLTRDRRIIATGYNGSIPGMPHCDDVGHDMVDGHCARVAHAEANAITQAAKHGVDLAGSSAYLTTMPCWPCFRMLVGAGIVAVYFDEEYRPDPRVADAAKASSVLLAGRQQLPAPF